MNSKVVSGIMPTLLLISMLTLAFNLHAVDAAPQENEHIRVYLDPLTIQDPIFVIGTEFSVNLTVENVENLWAYQFWLKFNPAVLHGVSVEDGPFLGSATDPRKHPVQVAAGAGFDNVAGELKLFGAFLKFTGVPPTTGI